jgi:hypothetical protein
MEAHDEWENRNMRRAIIDRDKVAVVEFKRYKVGLLFFPWTFSILYPSHLYPKQTLLSSFFFKVL